MSRRSLLLVLLGGLACSAGETGLGGGVGGVPATSVTTGGASGATTIGTGGVTGGSQGAGPATGLAYADLPCDVATVLKTNCSMCHGAMPAFGAPMSLVHAADFWKEAKDNTRTVAQAAVARINDNQMPMPPPPNARLTAADNSTLTVWLQGGANAGTCTSVGGGGGGSGTSSANDPTLVDPSGPGISCYDIRARNPSDGKFSVPATPDLYHCFHYSPPWGSQKVHLISWRPVIDNKLVIHHWLLYNETSAVTDKTDVDCSGAHPSAQLTAGWAPGGQGNRLPDDVGQDVSGAGFTLETHFNNITGSPAPDGSGIHMCVTTNLRPNEAGVHWLGTEVILLPAGGDATGNCIPNGPAPIHILQSIPHMHLQGRHLKTVINRADGTKVMLIDQPFDFGTQIGYRTPQVINTGDTLTTTCTYGGSAIYGQGTKNEMCYNFVLAYPNGALSSGSLLRKNGCTGL